MAIAKDWTHLFELYRGKWVALADDETTVLASGASAKEVHEVAPHSSWKEIRAPAATHEVPSDCHKRFAQ